jgi:hypothetical protein
MIVAAGSDEAASERSAQTATMQIDDDFRVISYYSTAVKLQVSAEISCPCPRLS